jgi:hypothetical protein
VAHHNLLSKKSRISKRNAAHFSIIVVLIRIPLLAADALLSPQISSSPTLTLLF